MTISKKAKKTAKPKPVKEAVTLPQALPAEPLKPVKLVESLYQIAPGKSITSKKGILGPGDQVKIEYVGGGQKTIDDRIKSGHIIKR